jgi:5-methylcytosine-specific restriction endonuclease McrA
MADLFNTRTRQMHATLKRRTPRFVLTLAEFRNLFGDFYGGYGRCLYCGKRLSLEDVSVDHKLPVSRGGRSYADNLQFVCKADNKSKGDMTHEEYKALLDSLDTLERGLRNFTLKAKILTALRVAASFRIGANRRSKKVGL